MASSSFSETLWFKLGEVAEADPDDATPSHRMRPIEDRYVGAASAQDKRKFGVHTGTTLPLQVVALAGGDDVAMQLLVREMKHRKHAVAITAIVALLCVLAILLVV